MPRDDKDKKAKHLVSTIVAIDDLIDDQAIFDSARTVTVDGSATGTDAGVGVVAAVASANVKPESSKIKSEALEIIDLDLDDLPTPAALRKSTKRETKREVKGEIKAEIKSEMKREVKEKKSKVKKEKRDDDGDHHRDKKDKYREEKKDKHKEDKAKRRRSRSRSRGRRKRSKSRSRSESSGSSSGTSSDDDPYTRFKPYTKVTLVNLVRKAELNGKSGQVVHPSCAVSPCPPGCLLVRLESGREIAVKAQNLRCLKAFHQGPHQSSLSQEQRLQHVLHQIRSGVDSVDGALQDNDAGLSRGGPMLGDGGNVVQGGIGHMI
eukprot:TRINITY_DN44482_c0_g1_i1.p1 TRINITY_DN44482_c0_g1~~TRINITY_DN44482_c0_g1_i1.p1  ORF type:complete len:321 (+),score=57.52 TRINITY_DN44482_c0_g1_i1:352-1314(+)